MKKVLITILCSLLTITLFGCANNTQDNKAVDSKTNINETVEDSNANKDESEEIINNDVTEDSGSENDKSDNDDSSSDNDTVPEQEPDNEPTSELTQKQKNSIEMLNYLTTLSQEINNSKNSRLYLENTYSALINNTYPNAVDIRTQAHLEDMLDTLENYRMLSVKRDRLQYIYNQNKAKALKQAIPNPMSVLNVVVAGNPLKAAISALYLAVDSYSSYTEYVESQDLQYLQDNWSLDDEEAKELHNSRTMAFSYMLDMVRNNEIPGDLTLNEELVEDYVERKATSNVVGKIQFFEANEDSYKALGEYWLTLAQNYYENEDYSKVLYAIEQYESSETRIFRKDYDYGKTLPIAIVSAREVLNEDEYISYATNKLQSITSNTKVSDWATQYFVAQTYMDLYSITNDKKYLEQGYEIEVNVVNELISEQQKLNKEYLADVVEIKADKNATKEEKNEIKSYNKMLKERRKTELPPISAPLELSCELLFGIADELDISDTEKNRVEKLIHNNGEQIFLNVLLDNQVRFSKNDFSSDSYDVTYEKNKLYIPAVLLSNDSIVKVALKTSSGTTVYDDWCLDNVDRNKKELEDFLAEYSSLSAKKIDYSDGDTISVQIFRNDKETEPQVTFKFKAKETKKFIFTDISFERVK